MVKSLRLSWPIWSLLHSSSTGSILWSKTGRKLSYCHSTVVGRFLKLESHFLILYLVKCSSDQTPHTCGERPWTPIYTKWSSSSHPVWFPEGMAAALGKRPPLLDIWSDWNHTDAQGQKTPLWIDRTLFPPQIPARVSRSQGWCEELCLHLLHALKMTRPDPKRYLGIIHFQQARPPFHCSLTTCWKMLSQHSHTQSDLISCLQCCTFHIHLHTNLWTSANI